VTNGLFGPRRDDELDEEVRSHLEMATRDRMERGESSEQARAAARREFGNVALVKEVTREFWGWRSAERFAQDLRFGGRLVRRHPSFAALAIACLALGVGVATTVFTAVNGLLLRPLPYANADRLAIIHTREKSDPPGTGPVAWADFVVWRNESRSFAEMGTYSFGPIDVVLSGTEARPAVGGAISPGVLPALGVTPFLGRPFDARDQQFGNHFVTILSHAYWLRHFGGRQDVVGNSLKIEARPAPPTDYQIVGVLPPGETFPENVDVLLPLQVDADEFDRHDQRQTRGAIGLLRPGVRLADARAEISAISERLRARFSQASATREAYVMSLRDELVGDRRVAVVLLQGAAVFVLIIAGANVANLTLSRATSRSREIAVRMALGASRLRLVRQLLTESLGIALLGGALGVVLAFYGTRALVLMLPGGLPGYASVSMDRTVLAFSIALSALAGLISGIAPALRETDARAFTLRSDASGGIVGGRLRQVLIATEVTLSFVLAIGALLLVRSHLLLDRELGFERRVIWVSVPTPAESYEGARREVFFNDLTERIRALPGVVSVGRAAIGPPLGPNAAQRVPITPEGERDSQEGERLSSVSEIDAAYLPTLGVPLVRGRMFTDADRPADGSARSFSAIVNETFANSYLAGRDPIGQRVRSQLPGAWSLGSVTFTIVGVARDYRQERPPKAIAPALFAYVPLGSSNTPLVIRPSTDTGAEVIAQHVRTIVRQMDPTVRVAVVQTFEQSIARGLAEERLYERVLGLFAALALGMAIVGIYGVISYAVSQRMREFGIRVALGAGPWQLVAMVLAQLARVTIVGLALGTALALLLTRLLSNVLYGIRPNDPATFLAVTVGVILVSLATAMAPARRAARVNPVTILKTE
jgi:predicted permease